MEEKNTTEQSQAGKTDIVEDLKKQLSEAQKLSEDYLAGWHRAKADLLNYKKEQAEFLEKIHQFAVESFILKILPVLDSFDESFKHAQNNHGLVKIYQQLWDILRKEGIEEINQTNVQFDPKIHESIGEVEGKDPNMVAEIAQKGYTLDGRLLRPARVKITK